MTKKDVYGKNYYKCYHCFYTANKFTNYRSHMRKHHPNSGIYDCPECEVNFLRKKNFDEHISEVHRIVYVHRPLPFARYYE